jgi:hypothetical protein
MMHLSLRRAVCHLLPCLAIAAICAPAARSQDNNQPPAGFTALFNGKDFDDWTGGTTKDPREIAALKGDERTAWDAKMKKGIHQHWHVDNGDLVSDGREPYLATAKEFGDFEMWVDWKINAKGDSGIYLRGVPQVQIWDPTNEKETKNGADKGSGGLWNNKVGKRDPLVKADKPIGEWNRMYIRMVGPYVLVKLNDKLVVDNVPLENFYDAKIPVFSRGPIYLQTHGSESRFRNVFLREIPAAESNKILAEIMGGQAGFEPIFNGKDLTGWSGALDSYHVVDGEIRCKEGKGLVLHTKENYDNFVVRLEFKLPPAGNNGLAIRVPDDVHDAAYEGLELQILDDPDPKYKNIHDYQHCGSVYGLAPAHQNHLRPVGEWNFEEATIDGDHVVVNLNGYEITNVHLADVREKTIDGKKHPGAFRTSGHFGFCGHTDPVAFRNIQIKKLPSN